MRIIAEFNNTHDIIKDLRVLETLVKNQSIEKAIDIIEVITSDLLSFLNKEDIKNKDDLNLFISLLEKKYNLEKENQKTKVSSIYSIFRTYKKTLFTDIQRIYFSIDKKTVSYITHNLLCCNKMEKELPDNFTLLKCNEILEPLNDLVLYESFPCENIHIYKEVAKKLCVRIENNNILKHQIIKLGFSDVSSFLSSSDLCNDLNKGEK